jgi:RHH-type proline utilization regulon transcriptional repressor/proline dehydrogenase/delta 1-pyrroline-5-carboxylate dehydrogenase
MATRASLTSSLESLRAQIRDAALRDESACVQSLLQSLPLTPEARDKAKACAAKLVETARAHAHERPVLDSFLQEFSLSNEEGVALMCLAEGLLRIPDDETADEFIADRLATGNWSAHSGTADSWFVNASTWALMLTGRLIQPPRAAREDTGSWLGALTRRMSAPVLRSAFRQAMRLIGEQFVVGRTIEEALQRSKKDTALTLCSFDMLGEGARTWADAQRYRQSYERALDAIGAEHSERPLHERSSLSVKLSALEPRYDLQHERLVRERLVPIVRELARRAARANIGFTIDAEEADRLDLSLMVFEALARDPDTRTWDGLGMVVQAYGKRAPLVIDWLAQLAAETGRRICVRLVKGAYWDAEIKRFQERGLPSYPVYTRKANTDVSYLACAARLFQHREVIYPQFATHNAFSIAAVLELAPPGARFEFQRLHGMGGLLYEQADKLIDRFPQIRTYAPVGQHEELLSYLVRRLLENGANSSFVSRFMNEAIPVEEAVEDPVALVEAAVKEPHVQLVLPPNLYGDERQNSMGTDWGNPDELARLAAAVHAPLDSERLALAQSMLLPCAIRPIPKNCSGT